MMQGSLETSVPVIRVRNTHQNKVAHLTVDELFASMSVLKDAVTNSRNFPLHVFDGKDFMVAEDELIFPKIKEKLQSLQRSRLNASLNDSLLSIDSPKCFNFPANASRVQTTRKLSVSEIVACKDLICSIVPGNILVTFSSILSSLIKTLSNPASCSPEFLVSFVTQSSTLLSIFPLVTQHLLKTGEIIAEIQEEWTRSSNDLSNEFKNNLVLVLQVDVFLSSIFSLGFKLYF